MWGATDLAVQGFRGSQEDRSEASFRREQVAAPGPCGQRPAGGRLCAARCCRGSRQGHAGDKTWVTSPSKKRFNSADVMGAPRKAFKDGVGGTWLETTPGAWLPSLPTPQAVRAAAAGPPA